MDGAKLRKQLLGGHVSAYMKRLQDKNPDEYKSHFSRFLKAGLEPDDLENMYKSAHTAIREDPTPKSREVVRQLFAITCVRKSHKGLFTADAFYCLVNKFLCITLYHIHNQWDAWSTRP